MHPKSIGPPGMIGVGPGDSLRKKSFDSLQKEVMRIVDFLKKSPQPALADIKGFLQHLESLKKDVKLYCGDFADLKEYQASYDRAVASLTMLSKLTDAAKFAASAKTEVPKLMRQVMYLSHATYFKPNAPTAAATPPTRPATPPPAPPRPAANSPKGKP